jgi:two-component system, cell cycle sensor histidine kinase DivJ
LQIFRAPFAQPVADWLDFLASRADRAGQRSLAQRKSFIAARLSAGVCALAFAPLWLLFHGLPNLREAALFTLMLTPFVSVAAFTRTGDMRLAQRVSICGWAALAIGVAATAHGYEALSVALLGTALIEAILTFEAHSLGCVIVGALSLVALDVFLEPTMARAAATRAEIAVPLTPLLMYVLALAADPILAERARTRREERVARDLRFLTEAHGAALVDFDASGAVTQIVGDAFRNYGLSERELRGRGFFFRVHVADRPTFLELVSDAHAGVMPKHALLRLNVGAVENVEAGRATAYNDFDLRPVDARARGGDREPQVVCILRDVTAARKAEEAVAEAQRRSEAAIAARTRLLTTVSHELRTPLNAIIGFAEMLADESFEPEDAGRRREYSRIIADSGRHLHEVVNSILDMSRIESGAMEIFPEPFAFGALLAQCCDMMQIKAVQARVALVRDFSCAPEEIVADQRACRQIALNLLSNAIKFTPPCGKVVLRAFVDGNAFVLSVSDTGVGVAPNDLARLGDPFFQAGASRGRDHEGAGLGLSVVRGLVDLHGGVLRIESAIEMGTTVTVRMPRDGRRQPERASGAAEIETLVRQGVREAGVDQFHEKEAVKKIA